MKLRREPRGRDRSKNFPHRCARFQRGPKKKPQKIWNRWKGAGGRDKTFSERGEKVHGRQRCSSRSKDWNWALRSYAWSSRCPFQQRGRPSAQRAITEVYQEKRRRQGTLTLEKQDEREGKLYVCFVLLLGRRRLGYTLRRSQSETKTRGNGQSLDQWEKVKSVF